MNDKQIKLNSNINSLYLRVTNYINGAKINVERSINNEMVKAYFLIGKEIVEEEQNGKERAEYGKRILHTLSVKLQNEYKRGFSVDTLEQARRLFIIYQLDSNTLKISDPMERKFRMPELSQKNRRPISEHVNNIYFEN